MAMLLKRPAVAARAAWRGYAWGCLFGDEFQITYLSGPARTCREIGAGLAAGQYQPKGRCATLAEARGGAEAAAGALQACYSSTDGARARALAAADFADWRLHQGLGSPRRRGVAPDRGPVHGARRLS